MASNALIIDDSKSTALALKEMLVQLGLEQVDVECSGFNALKLIREQPDRYNALFVDLHMPDLDGLELILQLDKMHYKGGIIIVSGLEQKIIDLAEEIAKKTHLRLLGSAAKPFSSSLLAFLVKRVRYLKHRVYPEASFVKRRELSEALQARSLVAYFQPKVSQQYSKLIGLECLARLDILGKGRISPDKFIPVAVKFGMYDDLFCMILEAAISEHQQFIIETGEEIPVSVNILPEQLKSEKLLNQLNSYTAKYDFPKELLMLEITEGQPIRTKEQLKNLNRLRINGFKLSLDDYGAGYTNLSQMQNLPFNEVKLDARMVTGIAHDPLLEVICKFTLDMANVMNMSMVAEGVETEEDLNFLEKIGVKGYQGYLICRPKPMDELLRWYRVWNDLSSNSNAS